MSAIIIGGAIGRAMPYIPAEVPARIGWTRRVAGMLPVALFAAHLSGGANGLVAQLCWVTAAAAMLGALLLTPWGTQSLARLQGRSLALLIGLAFVLLLVNVASVIRQSARGSLPLGPDWQSAGLDLISAAGLGCAFLTGALVGVRSGGAAAALRSFLMLGVVYCSLTLVAFAAGSHPSHGDFQQGRFSATFVSPNIAASLFGTVLLLAAIDLRRRWQDLAPRGLGARLDHLLAMAILECAAAVLAALCLLLTGSRLGVSLLAVGAALVGLSFSAPRRQAILVGLSFILLFPVVFILAVPARTASVTADMLWRLDLWRAHFRAFAWSPVWGAGIGSFARINAALVTPENAAHLLPMGAAHNAYLQWLETMGLAGTIVLTVVLLTCIGLIVTAPTVSTSARARRHFIVTLSMFVCLQAAVDYVLQVPSIAAQWAVFLGLGFGESVRYGGGICARSRVRPRPTGAADENPWLRS